MYNKGDTSNNRGDRDYFKDIQKIREQHTRKQLSQGTTENSHIGHCNTVFPRDIVCLRNMSISTLHKGDDDDDDDNNNNNNNNTLIWCEIISTNSAADTNQQQQHGTRNIHT